MRVFLGEPGAEHKETIATGSHAAAAGGVTTIVATPDTDPVIDHPALVEFIIRQAQDTAAVNVLPMASHHQRVRRSRDDGDGYAGGGRRGRLYRWPADNRRRRA